MPRRTLTPATPAPPLPPAVLPKDPAQLELSDPVWAASLRLLRRQWKWAAFSQFFYTFTHLFAMNDVTLVDIEDDLARGLSLFLPRVMTRLLYTLTQDRKISVDNWQTALRKQYAKRAPTKNPIGPEPPVESRQSSRELSESPPHNIKDESEAAMPSAEPEQPIDVPNGENIPESRDTNTADDAQDSSAQPPTDIKEEEVMGQPPIEAEESKDWLELPMLEKLNSMHLLTEWQFQNPHRLRQIMKSDDEYASWRIEPIGYDAKTNAYWLIGPDRLWLQRVPPRPPKGIKRKRPPARKSFAQAQASTSRLDDDDEYNSEVEKASPKRKRTQRSPTKPAVPSTPRPASRGTRSRRKSVPEPEPDLTGGRGSTRAAKMQANKKLDVQAKELAEFQRQAAAYAAVSRSSRPTRLTARAHAEVESSTPTRPLRSLRKVAAVGTRTSARLRGGADEDGDEEWQRVPKDWLHDTPEPTPSRPTRSSARKGKAKAAAPTEPEDDLSEEPEADAVIPNDILKTGLESDATSELTELSVEPEEEAAVPEAVRQPTPKLTGRSTRSRKRTRTVVIEEPEESEAEFATQDDVKNPAESDDEQHTDEPSTLPEDVVEWETICVTLNEWEHITERFEKATHYLEKALYKMLTQNIVPAVTAELREAEKRKKLEEAVVHRKRSSRIATKETEKEQAREAAKKKVEEQDKQSRAKRMEARAKKEETERQKKDKEREQRRLEREEREERARQKEERAKRRAEEADDQRASTSTPAAGTHSTESILLSSVPTPTGVQTPSWVLDCEICGKRGANIDDGLPMVSCGMCSRWQHIGCHDLADQRMGRPRRDWERQQFYCHPCRARLPTSANYIASKHQRYAAPQPSAHSSSWSQAAADPSIHPQKSTATPQAYYRDPLPGSQPGYGSGTNSNGMQFRSAAYPAQDIPPQPGYTRTQNGLTFSHYQPENRAFTSIRSSQQGTASPPIGHGWGNGYAPPQPGGGSFGGGMGSTSYQNAASLSGHPSSQFAQGTGTSQWAAPSGSNGSYPTNDSAVRSAAESLAFMQGGGGLTGPAQQNGWHRTHGSSVPQGNGGMY
ncbi:hypothetical protein C8Q72DRAFT_981055 [Fomitopsis betulina]|nr:hypothetical protein C8Q72DRAFT_981055 [Fomitopsis betulina]